MRGLTPYVICKDAARAIDFYVQVFAATETMRLAEPSGKIGHAELTIEGATLMLADEYPDHGARGPRSIGGSPVHRHLYVADAAAVGARPVAAGATVVRPLADQFYGDRSGTIEDDRGRVRARLGRRDEAGGAHDCACGSSGGAACGAGGVMAWGRGRRRGGAGARGC